VSNQTGWTTSRLQVVQEATERALDTQSRIDAGLQEVSAEMVLRDQLLSLTVRAPASATAFVAGSMWRVNELVPIAVDDTLREPFKVPSDDESLLWEILTRWSASPTDGVAAFAGELGLVVEVDAWSSFDQWWRSFATVEERPVAGSAGVPDKDAPTAVERDLPDLGTCTRVHREPVSRPRSSRTVTDRELMAQLGVDSLDALSQREVVEALHPTEDRGGWVVWPCGALARPRRVSDVVRVVDGDELVVLHPPFGADYRVSVAAGGRHAPFEVGELPLWLRKELKVH
jgi:hypothetical protein